MLVEYKRCLWRDLTHFSWSLWDCSRRFCILLSTLFILSWKCSSSPLSKYPSPIIALPSFSTSYVRDFRGSRSSRNFCKTTQDYTNPYWESISKTLWLGKYCNTITIKFRYKTWRVLWNKNNYFSRQKNLKERWVSLFIRWSQIIEHILGVPKIQITNRFL